MIVVAFISGTGERHALLTGCIGVLAILVAVQRELEKDGAGRHLTTVTLLAGLLCLVAFTGATPLVIAAVVACLVLGVATAVLHSGALAHRQKLSSLRPSQWGIGAAVTFTVGLLLLIAASIALGVLLASGGGGRSTDTVSISSPYRVSGTCVNGACTVNECKTPAPCGQENEGEVHEGTPLDIECQLKGEPAKAPNGTESRIWDRLESGFYISDLFVEGTADGHFTSSLLRCAGA